MKPVLSSDGQLFDTFSVQNDPHQGDDMSPLLNNFALQYVVMEVQVKWEGWKLNMTEQLLDYAWAKIYVL
jgi:hypothetical protein